ncbi:MAG TPA: MarR family transcriptional regulator [Solirubrobacteraceae bacterium]|jgi:DNA-binding MarR family transcriptional regulator|nr:MarR family transcriptional regulator [Solirubrobacteraceae bacterium]
MSTVGAQGDLVEQWRGLMARHAAVSCALGQELGERHGIGVHEFEVLENLVAAEDGKRRIQELSEAVSLSQSALSRLVARLEREGLVERCMCELDRRGIYASLTEAGRERHAEAQPTQRAVLARMLAD